MLTYPAGIKMYEEQCRATLVDMKGFEVEYHNRDNGPSETQTQSAKEIEKEVDEALGDINRLEAEVESGEVRIGA